MKAKVSTLSRRLEEHEIRNQHEVQAVIDILVPTSHASFVSPLSVLENNVQLFQ